VTPLDHPQVTLTTPSDREIVLTRSFRASSRVVFDALSRPELLTRWLGATGWAMVGCEVDLRVGGRWRFDWLGPGGDEMGHGGVYTEVAAPFRLGYTELYDNQSYEGETLISHELVERSGATTVTSTVRYATRAARDSVLAYPMARGVNEGFDRLERLLTEGETHELDP
jgi:uncharacterized protein YndB with AHSA1/START domain